MNNDKTRYWDELRGKIFSKKGGWVIGETVYNHGYSTMDDLVGEKTYFQVLVLNITDRMPERRLADFFEAVYNCLSWPDARIWCNRIGSLAGTMRTSPVAAVTAGILASDSVMYGAKPPLLSAKFFVEALKKKKQGMSVEDIINSTKTDPRSLPRITGYARPIATGDERVIALERLAKKLGFKVGEHLALAYEIEEKLLREYDIDLNVAGYGTAFFCDQGFTPEEQYRIFSLCVNSGITACYAEAADLPPESFYPLRCEDIKYVGKDFREVPLNGETIPGMGL